jgi:hypothetical protein
MEPKHTYLLPARSKVIGALSENPEVETLLRSAWARHGNDHPGPFEGASYFPEAAKIRVVTARDGEFDVLDIDPKTLDRLAGV